MSRSPSFVQAALHTVLTHAKTVTKAFRRSSMTEKEAPTSTNEATMASHEMKSPTIDFEPSFSQTIHPRSRRQSFTQQLTHQLSSLSRQTSNTSSLDVDMEKVDMNQPPVTPTIFEAATRAGKNGIPDIVIQCVEFLERMCLLQTEGIYRVPGSVKRVKAWLQRFEAHYANHFPTVSLGRSSKVRTKRSSAASTRSLERAATVQQKRISLTESRKLSVVAPAPEQQNTSDTSIVAANGSNMALKLENPPSFLDRSAVSSKSSMEKSVISLAYEESKRGVGLWDGDGLFGTPGFSVNLDNETAATVASLLKKFFSSIKGGFTPTELWDPLDQIALDANNEQPSAHAVRNIRSHLQTTFTSRHHLHTFAYFVLHLQRVSSYAEISSLVT
ncbi:Rho GTPase activation protein [Obelidium mucronatum]|nr:Rho GTPase activation protein [Obelidium mucronatum]